MNNRRSIRLPLYDYSSPGEYFITVCVKGRLCLLGEVCEDEIQLSNEGSILEKWILHLKVRYPAIEVNHFIIMPDHFHLIIEIRDSDHKLPKASEEPRIIKRRKMLLSKAIGYLKMNSAKEINLLNDTPGLPFWQGNYFERIIRDEAEYHKIVEYIKNNPLNWEADTEKLPWE